MKSSGVGPNTGRQGGDEASGAGGGADLGICMSWRDIQKLCICINPLRPLIAQPMPLRRSIPLAVAYWDRIKGGMKYMTSNLWQIQTYPHWTYR